MKENQSSEGNEVLLVVLLSVINARSGMTAETKMLNRSCVVEGGDNGKMRVSPVLLKLWLKEGALARLHFAFTEQVSGYLTYLL